ncbi:hypothetical protein L1987_01187 [Smallanthus sonchifolius]|uniref:Uncharacterized protein n=1 Tax=Smallanthus sonchifolius TaxID=185202 RepID=A0ACB9K4E9_9ASTR|nr:hypothetical protein L1987_01187 [Smallanthus sonchifolius]
MGRKKEVVFDEQPPDFDPADPYKDPVAMIEMREHMVREKWIDIETSNSTWIPLVVLGGVKTAAILINTLQRFRAWSDVSLTAGC